MQTIKDSIKTIAISLITLSLVSVAYAWTEPTSTPPADNVNPPITTSSDLQTKAGWFTADNIETYGKTTLATVTGNVGIGIPSTETLTEKLEVDGNMRVKEVILSSAGSAVEAAIRFFGDDNTGLFSPATDTLALTTNGVERFRIDSSGNATLNSTLDVAGQSTLSSLDVTGQSITKGGAIVGDEIEATDITYKTKTFTFSGTFDVPAGVTMVTVTMNGAGGAGGDGSNHSCYGGGGGGGGASVSKKDVFILAGESIAVTVGAAGVDCGDKCATDGGASSFGDYITTYGGKAGSPGKGGAGGAAGGEGGTAGAGRSGCKGGAGGVSLYGSGGGGGRGGDGYGDGANGGAGYVFVEWYESTKPLFGASKLRVNGESLFLADKKIDDNPSNYYVSNKRYHVEASKAKVQNTVPLDMAIVNDLCKDEDGCSVTMGMRNWDSGGKPGATASRAFKFYMSKTSDWWRLSNDAEANDGNGVVNHIFTVWACYFTDGEYTSGTGTDSLVQLGLLNWTEYPDTNMVCTLTMDD